MSETTGSEDEKSVEEIAAGAPSAGDATEQAAEDPSQVADRDEQQTAERDSDAGEDYAGSGL